jgi:uncharacterized protein (DUF302 family)
VNGQAKLREKLGIDACNPPIAHQALQCGINLGLILPRNVVVYAPATF